MLSSITRVGGWVGVLSKAPAQLGPLVGLAARMSTLLDDGYTKDHNALRARWTTEGGGGGKPIRISNVYLPVADTTSPADHNSKLVREELLYHQQFGQTKALIVGDFTPP